MIKLHLGCGRVDFGNQWDHVDEVQLPHIKSFDLTDLPYESESVGIIYASHVIAYFDKQDVVDVLKEWNRVLSKDGQLYIATPDFKAMAELYIENSYPIEDFIGPLYGRRMGDDRFIYHKYCYDARTLSKVLHYAGFKQIELVESGFQIMQSHKDQSWSYLPDRSYKQGTLISLNLIATK